MKIPFISNKALDHSSRETFVYSKSKPRMLKMKNGGHGQENIAFLTKRRRAI